MSHIESVHSVIVPGPDKVREAKLRRDAQDVILMKDSVRETVLKIQESIIDKMNTGIVTVVEQHVCVRHTFFLSKDVKFTMLDRVCEIQHQLECMFTPMWSVFITEGSDDDEVDDDDSVVFACTVSSRS
jgi:hypothetical protein